ncbi:MAG: hypothetical protein ACKESB_00085 [Candidatus Hodgkinia cicadicola]
MSWQCRFLVAAEAERAAEMRCKSQLKASMSTDFVMLKLKCISFFGRLSLACSQWAQEGLKL